MEDPDGRRGFVLQPVFREEGEGSPAEAVAALADREKVVALVGPLLSDSAERVFPAAAARSLALLSPTACSPRLEGRSRLLFRTCMTMDAFAESLAAYAAASLGEPRFVIALPADPYGRALAAAFRRGLAAAGGSVLLSREYPAGAPDAAGWAQALREELGRVTRPGEDLAPDGLFFAGSAAEAGAILPQLGQRGLLPRSTAVVGGSALDTPDFPRLAGSWAEGSLVADAFFAGSERPGARVFVERYRKRYGSDPGPAAAQACAAVELLAEALRGGGATRDEVLARLRKLGAVETVLGSIRIHPGGKVERRPFFMTVRGGRLEEVGTP
jgi:branched-chain amino acid transport system substrate-binding protein